MSITEEVPALIARLRGMLNMAEARQVGLEKDLAAALARVAALEGGLLWAIDSREDCEHCKEQHFAELGGCPAHHALLSPTNEAKPSEEPKP